MDGYCDASIEGGNAACLLRKESERPATRLERHFGKADIVAEKYEKRKRINPTGFASLDQQRPSAEEGNKIRAEWFNILKPSELPFNADRVDMGLLS